MARLEHGRTPVVRQSPLFQRLLLRRRRRIIGRATYKLHWQRTTTRVLLPLPLTASNLSTRGPPPRPFRPELRLWLLRPLPRDRRLIDPSILPCRLNRRRRRRLGLPQRQIKVLCGNGTARYRLRQGRRHSKCGNDQLLVVTPRRRTRKL